METGRFTIKASSDKMVVSMTIAVKSTGACVEGRMREAQNTFWDILRDLNFDADNISLGRRKNDTEP